MDACPCCVTTLHVHCNKMPFLVGEILHITTEEILP